MKVVLDTNVLLSGLMFPEGTPGRTVAAWVEARFEVALSLDQLAEIGRVLEYPKIRRKLGWDDRQIELFIKQLYIRAEVVELGSVDLPSLSDRVPVVAVEKVKRLRAFAIGLHETDAVLLHEVRVSHLRNQAQALQRPESEWDE